MESKSEATEVNAAAPAVPKIRWNTEKMRNSYANVVNVASTREEMNLLFGTNQAWHSAQQEIVVELSERIVLNPYAAKRLLLLLGKVVEDYEAKYGVLQVEAGQPKS